MSKRRRNKRKWKAELYEHKQVIDQNDRPVAKYVLKRADLFYSSLGIASNEKYLSRQEKREVTKRISIVMDRTITETGNRIKIVGVMYQITRIYLNESDKEMELSLAHVT